VINPHHQHRRGLVRTAQSGSTNKTCCSALLADQALLLPLTQSLYVKGKVAETEKVMVNIGTDYYVEVSSPHGASRQ
jgi:prefoldin alpha subunit